MLDSQYPIGGWPQRYPLSSEYSHHGRPDYTSLHHLQRRRRRREHQVPDHGLPGARRPASRCAIRSRRAMDCFLVPQQGQPQPGWGLQHTLGPEARRRAHLRAGGAARPTPRPTTSSQLMNFYDADRRHEVPGPHPRGAGLAGQRSSCRRSWSRTAATYPTFIEIGTNRPLYVHRRGSNVVNGEYYVDYNPEKTVGPLLVDSARSTCRSCASATSS